MRLTSLGSGSEGNGWLFEYCSREGSGTVFMVDCGFTTKEAVIRLNKVGIDPLALHGIVVTHEHDDHIGGAFKFSRKFGTKVYLTHGTWRAALRSGLVNVDYLTTGRVCLIDSHRAFELGDLVLHPFPVPHDANEPVQLLIERPDGLKVGILTDCGSVTPHLIRMLDQSDVLVLESNHCAEMLANSPYPPSLKRRVGGDYGHLSNDAALAILRELRSGRLKYAIAAHLSQNTNSPDLVHRLWESELRPRGIPFGIANQSEGYAWFDCDLLP